MFGVSIVGHSAISDEAALIMRYFGLEVNIVEFLHELLS